MVHEAKALTADVLIPARNAAKTLPAVIRGIPPRQVRSIVVVDNDSSDATAQVALDAGAVVVREPKQGYGLACQRGVRHLEALPHPPDAVVFLAADGSDDSTLITSLLDPMRRDNAELVIGSRGQARGTQAKLGVALIGALYRFRFSDLGPFRAIHFPALVALGLRDPGFGYHAEMQVKAVKLGLQIVEVPVRSALGRGRRARSSLPRTLYQIVRHSTVR